MCAQKTALHPLVAMEAIMDTQVLVASAGNPGKGCNPPSFQPFGPWSRNCSQDYLLHCRFCCLVREPGTKRASGAILIFALLSIYAVNNRYPGNYEATWEEQYRDACEIAGVFVDWVGKWIG